ncbi:leucine-rich repeat-containing protein 47-like [Ornithodoros turicata]|uniref:leucine-rich repeat-containing protein 47-like n=1 Tax=Ornithodoros turicata TaxID=34597 RepID=UPI003139EA74
MAPAWQEVQHAKVEKRCELVLSGPPISKRIEEEGHFDASVFALTHLNFLEVSHTCLSTLPDGIARLVNLTRLVLSANQLTQVPAELGSLKKLKFLDISNNGLESIPPELSRLSELQSFNVSFNKLSFLPDDFKSLSHLIVLNFACNEIVDFPTFLTEGKFDFLTEVVGNKNCIASLPRGLEGSLPALKVLDVSANNIKEVPGEIGDCLKLKEIHLKDNPISDKRLRKLVDQCHYKQVLEYIKNHGPRDVEVTQDKGGKKGKKKKGGAAANATDVQAVANKFEILQLQDTSPVVVATDEVHDVRPYVVCCILRKVQLDKEGMLRKFLTLQNKLHDTLCAKRTEATIATHDLSKLSGKVTYSAKPPEQIKLTPLGRTKEMTALELYQQLAEEADALRKEKKRSTYPGIYKYLYLLKDKQRYPYLADDSGQVLSFPPITNSQGTRISEETRDVFVEVTGNSLPFCKKVMDVLLIESLKLGLGCDGGEDAPLHSLVVEKVKIVDKEGSLRVVYPSKTDLVCEGIALEVHTT